MQTWLKIRVLKYYITDALVNADSLDVSKIAGITSFKAAAGVTTGNSAAVTNLGANKH